MLSGIDGIMNLAAASGEDLAKTSDIVTDALTGFGLSAADSSHFADVLAAASSNANTNVSMLGESFKYVAPLAGAMKYSAEDTAIALGIMANSGIKASQAGTALRGAISSMLKPSENAANAMEKYGISLIDSSGNAKSLKDVMDNLRTTFGQMTEAEKSQVAATIFGTEAMSGMLSIINASDADYQKLTNSIYNADGATKKMADTMQNNLKGKITAFKSALEGAGIAIGEVLIPHLTKIVEKFTGVVQGFNKLNPEIQNSIVKYGLLAAAIGPVLSIAGKMTMGIGGLIKGFSLLGSGVSTAVSAMGGLGSVIGLITGPIGIATGVIVAAVVAWKTNFAGFRDACKSIFEDLGRIFNTLKDRYINLWNDIKDAWDSDLGGIQTMLTTGWENVTTVFESTFKAIADIFDLFADAFEGDWNGVWENVFSITNGLMDGFQEAWSNSLDAMISVLENWFPSLEGKLDKLPDIFNKVWDFIQEGMNIGIENIRLTFEAIGKIFKGDFGGAFELFKNRWSDAWDTIVEKVGEAKDSIEEKLPEIKETITTNLGNIAEEAGPKAEEIKTAIVDKFNTIKDDVGEKLSGLKDTVSEKIDDAKEAIEDKKSEISEAMGKLFEEAPEKIGYGLGFSIESVKNWGSNLYETMSTNIPEIVDNIGTWFSELPSKVSKWFDETKTNISTWGSDVIESVGDSLKELPDKISEWFDKGVESIGTWASNSGSSVKEAGTNIVNSITDGFKELPNKMFEFGMTSIQKLWDGIKSAAGFLGNLFNDIFGDFFSGAGLGAAMADFTQTFNGYMQELGSSAKDAFGNIVNDLESGAINVEQFGISVEQYLAGAISTMSDMGVSAEDLAAAINQIPEEKRAEVIALITGKEESEELKSAIEQVEGKSVDVNANTTGTEGVSELDQAIEGTEGKDVDVNAKVGGTGEVKELDSSIRQVPPTKDATVTATTKGLGALQTMQSTIAGINSKTVTITAIMNGNVTQNAPGGGKWTLATGTENANSGLTEVAEYGPELIMSRSGASAYLATERQLFNMEGGERVFNARQTSEILRSAAERNSTKNNSNIEKLLNEAITRLDRIKDATNNNSIEVTKAIENKELVSNVNLDSNSLAKGITPSIEKEQGNRMLLYKRGVLV